MTGAAQVALIEWIGEYDILSEDEVEREVELFKTVLPWKVKVTYTVGAQWRARTLYPILTTTTTELRNEDDHCGIAGKETRDVRITYTRQLKMWLAERQGFGRPLKCRTRRSISVPLPIFDAALNGRPVGNPNGST